MTTARMTEALPTSVDLREVGPRDGLQPERPVTVDQRVALIDALVGAGATHVEAVAFVSPRVVPAMAGAAEVLARIARPEGVRIAALVPNVRGAELALAEQVDELTVTISASPAYNERNVHMTPEESEVVVGEIAGLAAGSSVPVDAVVSCAFGSPYEGDLPPAQVAELGSRLLAAGCACVTYADTTGMATPRRVHELLDRTGSDVGLHLHDTRGTGLVNAYAGLLRGVRRFDTSVGGLGGSPFAAGATGNVATEELVALLDDLGVASGFDIERLCDAASFAGELLGHPVPSRVAVAGPRTRLVTAQHG
ncbi:MAG TPA: hydroxymethylglutaryl-CoA lyase [Acidimicrobiales bacterium]|jgi:hydroxymethylglutaryl-CoA lyase|nr:hydroxymethylglutaryl-CoA lyase [Acidimicrobiales bacterium]